MSYNYANLSDTLSTLSARLYDDGVAGQPAFQQWNRTELTGYVQESLRTWNALSGFWRTAFNFNLTQFQTFYDLHSQNGSPWPYTVTQEQLIAQIENHLLEPPTTSYPLTWAGSNQFALQDILSALQRRQDETLGTTAFSLNTSNTTAPLNTGPVALNSNVIDIRRVAWLPGNNNYAVKILRQADLFAQRAFNPGYVSANSQPPRTWFQSTDPPIRFSVDFTPPVAGNYNLLTVNAGNNWTANNASNLQIPDDWAWVLKWGALYDLLSRESSAKDALRAEYCLRRYKEGLAMLTVAPTVLALFLNGSPMAVDPLAAGDAFNPSWQQAGNLAPTAAYLAANVLAFGVRRGQNAAWSGNYTATVNMVQNAPVPANNNDYIQVAKDDYDTVIDYAQHLAMFKLGGAEFGATVSLYQKFQRKAAQYNGKLAEMGFFEWDMQDLGTNEEAVNARYAPGSGPAAKD